MTRAKKTIILLRNLEGFFAMQKWEFITKSPNVSAYAKIFKVMVYLMIFWPIGSILAWGISGILYFLFYIFKKIFFK